MTHFDLAVLGSGFAGSLTAMLAKRLGRSVVLLERGRHPRFAIGESSTPLANWLLEDLCDRYDLPRLRPLSKWATWQTAYPQIGCGLKRGFSFFHHCPGEALLPESEHRNQLLVAASPNDAVADTHWYRPDLDHFLVKEAQAAGVEYWDQVELRQTSFGPDSVCLDAEESGRRLNIRAKFVIDASGPRGALHRALHLRERPLPHMPGTQALFTHFQGVKRLADLGVPGGEEVPPYPVDDAALHHVFAGGWIWVLRFNNGLTSAGAALTDRCAEGLGLEQGARAWERLLARFPTIRQQFGEADAVVPFKHMPQLSFSSAQVHGPNWALLPSAAGFVDPLLSTGFTLTLLGVRRLIGALAAEWGRSSLPERLADYSETTVRELLAVERLVAALYAHMGDFESFIHLARLYFAPVSFAEIANRLGLGELAGSFLLHDAPLFGPNAAGCLATVLEGSERSSGRPDGALAEMVLRAIAPIDVIGLSDPTRRNWYPVRRDDLLNACAKFGLTEDEVDRRLRAIP